MYLYETFPCSWPQRLYKANMDWKVSQLLAETWASNTSGEVKNDTRKNQFVFIGNWTPHLTFWSPKLYQLSQNVSEYSVSLFICHFYVTDDWFSHFNFLIIPKTCEVNITSKLQKNISSHSKIILACGSMQFLKKGFHGDLNPRSLSWHPWHLPTELHVLVKFSVKLNWCAVFVKN